MRIAVIGAGHIGGTLGAGWAEAGHEVVFGARDQAKSALQELVKRVGPRATTATVAESIESAEVVLLALPGRAADECIRAIGSALDGRIVIDATNKIGAAELSAVGAITGAAPRALVFRAFNSLGWENFRDPSYAGVQVDLFFCGPDGDARSRVEELISDIGLRPIWVGGMDRLPAIDSLVSLWFALVQRGFSRRTAFKLLTEH